MADISSLGVVEDTPLAAGGQTSAQHIADVDANSERRSAFSNATNDIEPQKPSATDLNIL